MSCLSLYGPQFTQPLTRGWHISGGGKLNQRSSQAWTTVCSNTSFLLRAFFKGSAIKNCYFLLVEVFRQVTRTDEWMMEPGPFLQACFSALAAGFGTIMCLEVWIHTDAPKILVANFFPRLVIACIAKQGEQVPRMKLPSRDVGLQILQCVAEGFLRILRLRQSALPEWDKCEVHSVD